MIVPVNDVQLAFSAVGRVTAVNVKVGDEVSANDVLVQLDTTILEAKVKEAEAFDAAVRIIGIKARRDLMGVLTPEQQAKQKALWQQYRHHDRGHMMRAETADSANDAVGFEDGRDGSEVGTSDVESGSSAG